MEIMNIKKKRNGDYEIPNPYDENKLIIKAKYAEMLCQGVYGSLSIETAVAILATFEILRNQACCLKYHKPISFQTSKGVGMVVEIINHHGIGVIGDIETYQDIIRCYDGIQRFNNMLK